jgi:transposase
VVDAGVDSDAIKVALTVGSSTYRTWLSLYRKGGESALVVRPAPGGPTKLTERQMTQLRAWIIGSDPTQFRFDFQLRTRKIIRDLIRQRFNIEFGSRMIRWCRCPGGFPWARLDSQSQSAVSRRPVHWPGHSSCGG